MAWKPRRAYQPRIVGDNLMLPADLRGLHKYMLDIEAHRSHLGRNAGRCRKRMARAGAQASAEEGCRTEPLKD
jgi:hypothetical protein